MRLHRGGVLFPFKPPPGSSVTYFGSDKTRAGASQMVQRVIWFYPPQLVNWRTSRLRLILRVLCVLQKQLGRRVEHPLQAGLVVRFDPRLNTFETQLLQTYGCKSSWGTTAFSLRMGHSSVLCVALSSWFNGRTKENFFEMGGGVPLFQDREVPSKSASTFKVVGGHGIPPKFMMSKGSFCKSHPWPVSWRNFDRLMNWACSLQK